MPEAGNSHEAIRFLEGVAELYRGRFLKPLWERNPKRESDPWDALAIFIEGYAFERQAVARDYVHASIEAVRALQSQNVTISDDGIGKRCWQDFKQILGDSALEGFNESNNPLCPKRIEYRKKDTRYRTRFLSAPEFCRHLAREYRTPNILEWTRRGLESGNRGTHRQLKDKPGINGVGTKIASFWLRDVADWYDVAPEDDRQLLQPVDIWIRRIVNHLMGQHPVEVKKLTDSRAAPWIVERSREACVSPERVNQGMWYFGSQICGSDHRLRRALSDLSYAEGLVSSHLEELRAGGAAADPRDAQ